MGCAGSRYEWLRSFSIQVVLKRVERAESKQWQRPATLSWFSRRTGQYRDMTDYDTSWQALLHPQLAGRVFDRQPPPPFHPTANFDWSLAWWMAGVCQVSYLWSRLDSPTPPAAGFREDVLARHGFTEHAFVDEGAIQGILVERGDTCILAFRGTDDPDDWRTNIRIEAASWPGGGRVHRGFLDAFEGIVTTLQSLRRRFAHRQWLLAGHSQGAAMAVLSATLTRPLAVYGFGCPRMGDRVFAARLEGTPIHQVVHERDIITRLPPDLGDFRVCLPGNTHQISGGEIRKPATDMDPAPDTVGETLAQRLANPGDWHLPIKELQDHAIVNYIAAIERLPQATTP